MRTVNKVILGLGAGSIAAAGIFVLLRPGSSMASVTPPSALITAPITVEAIPKGLPVPHTTAQQALNVAFNGTGTMMLHASSIAVSLVTAGGLEGKGIMLPAGLNVTSSGELWIVSINGLNMPPAGPAGVTTNLPDHHQLNVVVNALTGASVESYSNK